MAAASCAVTHNWKTRTIVYTFSEKIYFDLITNPGEGTKIEADSEAVTDVTDVFAVYKPELDGTYAAPDGEGEGINLYEEVTLLSVLLDEAGETLTVTYNGDFEFVDVTEFGYIVYPILYKAYTDAADTDSSANHIQACFGSPTEIPVVNVTARNTKAVLTTPVDISTSDGALYYPTKKNEKCAILLYNTDSSNTETVIFYDGDHIQAVGLTTTVTLAKSTNGVIQLETGKYLNIGVGTLLEGAIYFTGTADVEAVAIELP